MKLSTIFERLGDRDPIFEGNGWAAHCPAHADSKPSLRVAVAEGDKLLLKCRAGCSTEAVLDAIGVDSFSVFEPVSIDVAQKGRKVNDTGEPVSIAAQAQMTAYLTEAATHLEATALGYVQRRFGITADAALELGLGFDDGSLCITLQPITLC